MADTTPGNRLTYQLLYLSLVAALFFAQLLPLDQAAGQVPGPDILLLLTLAWLIRRPDFVPVWIIAIVFLLADFVFMRAPGLWAALVVILTEMIRTRRAQMRDQNFALEWLTVSVAITAATLVAVVVQAIFLVDQPALGLTLIRLAFTCLAYPLVVVLGARAFGLRRPAAGQDFRPLGGRL